MSSKIDRLRVENQTLLDKISILKLQVQQTDKESRRLRGQLQCLKLLVKRSWAGDNEASIHVANILGVAPPSLEAHVDSSRLVAVPKSRALNNWAMFTVGVLKNLYAKHEDILYKKKREYLLERESYLDAQLNGYVNDDRFYDEKDLDLMMCIKANEPATKPSTPPCKSLSKIYKKRIHSVTNASQSKPRRRECKDLIIESVGGESLPTSPTNLNIEFKSPASSNKRKTSLSCPATARSTKSKLSRKIRKATNGHITTTQAGRRPVSAFPLKRTGYLPHARSSGHMKKYHSETTMRQLDVVERELRKTTVTLQKKLSLQPTGFIK
ncbi:uncharacterized protein LOC130614671 [Hydractinia symbiolongicarpus]|uniref:uncharacterized protein LOC130614671 n=1 Tax=Hydractinia symbiolongicarpus TaxID=13093 RepID=UPI00254FBC2F|nr:uncharacterized protein LOC130614671 [Hydractinia symbiolongicarpus]